MHNVVRKGAILPSTSVLVPGPLVEFAAAARKKMSSSSSASERRKRRGGRRTPINRRRRQSDHCRDGQPASCSVPKSGKITFRAFDLGNRDNFCCKKSRYAIPYSTKNCPLQGGPTETLHCVSAGSSLPLCKTEKGKVVLGCRLMVRKSPASQFCNCIPKQRRCSATKNASRKARRNNFDTASESDGRFQRNVRGGNGVG